MIAEAIDTLWTLGWALIVWICLLAAVAGLIVYAVVITVWATARAAVRAYRWLRARLADDHEPHAPPAPPAAHKPAQRRTPSWARTDHHDHDYEEAA